MPHIFFDLDYTVSVFAVRAGRVLLVHHRQLGRWLPLGGHIEIGEDPESAALREAREESGLEVELVGERPPREFPGTTVLTAPAYLDIHDIAGSHRHIGMIYFARVRGDAEPRLAEREHRAIRWFTLEELAEPVYDVPEAIRFYAGEAIRRLGRNQE